MPPIGAIVAVIFVIRAIVNARNKKNGQPPQRVAANLAQLGSVFLVFFAFFAWVLVFDKGPGWLVMALPFTFFGVPSAFVRWGTVPLGLPRASYYLSRFALAVWYRQRHHGPCFAAAWALNSPRRWWSKGPSAKDVEWVWQRLQEDAKRDKLRGPFMVAQGLTHAARGEREEARRCLRSACGLSVQAEGRPVVFRVALQWCLADSAERGAWSEVLELVRERDVLRKLPSPKGRTFMLWRAVARRATGETKPGDLGLWMRWAWAPRRRHTFALVRAVLAYARPGVALARRPVGTSRTVPRSELPAVLEEHAREVISVPPRSATGLQLLEHAWLELLASRGFGETLRKHAHQLEVVSPEVCQQRLHDAVARDFETWVSEAAASGAKLPDGPLLGSAARERVRACEDELDLLVSRVSDKLARKEVLDPVQTWREFLAVRALHEQVSQLGGMSARRASAAHLGGPLNSLAARVFNETKEKALGNQMFRWLLCEATAVGDSGSLKMLTGNVNCGAAF